MEFKDYYQALGVDRNATQDEIRKAYRKLAHEYHPDITKDPKGEEKFKEVGEAYATLKNPETRQAYDELGKHPAGAQFTPPPEWQQQFYTDGSAFDDVDLSDLFASFAHARQAGRTQEDSRRRGQDFEISAPVTIEQIFSGAEIDVRAQLPEYDQNGIAHRVARTFRITVPKGAADGQRLRLAGKGGPGLNGGRPGDLYVALVLQPHALYRVSGQDVYIDLPLAPWEAVLGADVEIPTLAGAVELKIKSGTTSGQKLRLANRGLTGSDGTVGSMYALVRIEVPKNVSSKERALFEQLASVSRFSPRDHFVKGAKS